MSPFMGKDYTYICIYVSSPRSPHPDGIKDDMKTLPNIHSGEVLLEEFFAPLGISQNALARAAGVPPRRINERAGQAWRQRRHRRKTGVRVDFS
jgi:hypothetical protein